MHEVDRKYRIDPDKSDTLYVMKLIETNKKSTCDNFKESLGGISYDIIRYYTHELVREKLCLDSVLDNISYWKARQVVDCPACTHPIYTELRSDPEYDTIMLDYILRSGYLGKCDLIADDNRQKKKYLSGLVEKYYTRIISDKKAIKGECFLENIEKLKPSKK